MPAGAWAAPHVEALDDPLDLVDVHLQAERIEGGDQLVSIEASVAILVEGDHELDVAHEGGELLDVQHGVRVAIVLLQYARRRRLALLHAQILQRRPQLLERDAAALVAIEAVKGGGERHPGQRERASRSTARPAWTTTSCSCRRRPPSGAARSFTS